jgi:hypothetical protein
MYRTHSTSAQHRSRSDLNQVFDGSLGVRAKHLRQDSECVVRSYVANASPLCDRA